GRKLASHQAGAPHLLQSARQSHLDLDRARPDSVLKLRERRSNPARGVQITIWIASLHFVALAMTTLSLFVIARSEATKQSRCTRVIRIYDVGHNLNLFHLSEFVSLIEQNFVIKKQQD